MPQTSKQNTSESHSEPVDRVIDLGDARVSLLDGGALRLDGGAMFGVIPKPLWSRRSPADDANRIQLACNCLLIEWADPPAAAATPSEPRPRGRGQGSTAARRSDGQRRVIIETGHGAKYDQKECRIFAIDPARWLLPTLERRGIDPAGITDVVVTHLHFDHAGGLTRRDGDRVVPTFPNARVHVQQREFEDARDNFGIMSATYRPENLDPISRADAWRFLDGEQEILPGIRALPTPGHTRGHHSIVISGSSRTLVFPGDVLPTAAHAGAAWNMAYDLFPLENRESKRRLLATAASEDWRLLLDHEPEQPLLRVTRDGDWFALHPDNG
jgi:glyoxylase-like metal-dependent hydrolase (beta-lactamase superfamily II)